MVINPQNIFHYLIEIASFKIAFGLSLKNNKIEPFEVAKHGAIFVATFLHTRSFNILRRSGIGVNRKNL